MNRTMRYVSLSIGGVVLSASLWVAGVVLHDDWPTRGQFGDLLSGSAAVLGLGALLLVTFDLRTQADVLKLNQEQIDLLRQQLCLSRQQQRAESLASAIQVIHRMSQQRIGSDANLSFLEEKLPTLYDEWLHQIDTMIDGTEAT